jgi:acyl-CoA thioester hydrolase
LTTATDGNGQRGQAVQESRLPALTFRGVVYQWHLDHMGHMNVQHYVGMFDNASWVLLGMLGMDAAWFREHDRGMAALEQNIRYVRELRAGDVVEIRSGVLELGEKTMRIVHEMRNSAGDWVAARTTIVAVYFDTKARKGLALPEAVRERIRVVMVEE